MTDRIAATAADDEDTAAGRARELSARARGLARSGDLDAAAATFRAALAAVADGDGAAEREQAVRVLNAHARMLNRNERSAEALELYDAAAKRAERAAGEPWAAWRLLYALYGRGLALWRLDRHDAAFAALSRFREVLLTTPDPVTDDERRLAVDGLLLRASIPYDRRDYDAAVAAYAEIVERDDPDSDIAWDKGAYLRLGHATWWQAWARADAGDREGSAAASREGIARLEPWDEDDDIAFYVAELLYSLGYQLDALGEHGASLEALADLVERYGERDEPPLRRMTARALDKTSEELFRLGGLDEALERAEEVERRYGVGGWRPDDKPELREDLADAAHRRVAILLRRGRTDEAVEAARALLVRFGDDEDATVRASARAVRFDLGAALMERGDHAEAQVVLEGFLADPGPDAGGERIVRARMARALAWHQGGRPEDAAEEYERLLAEPALAGDGLRSVRVSALINLTDALARAGDDEAMYAAHRRFVAAVADDVAGAFAALRVEVAQRDPDGPLTRVQNAQLDLKEAATLGELEREEEARAALRAVISRWGDDELPDVAAAVEVARELLGQLGDD